MKYDIIIIGGGPAGICAAIYGLRANKKVLIIEKEIIGGKIASAPLVENYPGVETIKGSELSDRLQKQVIKLGGEIVINEVIKIEDTNKQKQVITKEKTYQCYAIIIATGTKYKMLGIEKETELIGKGISFCAVCDGFFYKNKTVAVIGGGNTAIVNALELANVCQKVFVIEILDHLTAEPILIHQVEEKQNVEILYHTKINKMIGENYITGIEIERHKENSTLLVSGVFMAIGQIPQTEIAKEMIQLDSNNYIHINEDGMTNRAGIFAAGDCVNKKIKQLTTAVNDGTVAALNAIQYIDRS